MKQAIMIGAGNIGRGFIGAILSRSGYHVTFADVNMTLIDAINAEGRYTVHIQDRNPPRSPSRTLTASAPLVPELARGAETAELVTTAVGLRILPIVAKPIAAGIAARKAAGNAAPLNIVACENAVRATSQLKNAVYALLDDETKAFADANVGFADCAVDRIVPKMDFAAPLDVAVEEFSEWDVERSGWKGELPQIDGMTVVDDLSAYIERKLFTLNSGHAICAYLGCLRGHHTILDSVSDPVIGPIVYRAMQQSGAGLVEKVLDGRAETSGVHRPHFARFHNPYLQDEVARVGREPIRKLAASDRLIDPLLTAYNFRLPVDQLIFGAAAALRYDNAEDPQSVELQKTIAEQGPPLRWRSIPASPPIIRSVHVFSTFSVPLLSKLQSFCDLCAAFRRGQRRGCPITGLGSPCAPKRIWK